MKLFIRTQDKYCLFELKGNLYIDNIQEKFYLYANPQVKNTDIFILGEFKKEENAIKVLDDIQRVLINYRPLLGKNEEFYKVYQIPKEEEIDK